MSARPKINVAPEPIDRVYDIGSIVVLVTIWVLTIVGYFSMPDTIAVHFDGSGNPNGFGSKGMLFIAPGFATGTLLLLMFINTMPHAFNYNVTITEENAPVYYRIATRMIRMMNFSIMLTFLAVAYALWAGGGGAYIVIVAVALPIIPIIWYFVKLSGLRKNQ